MDKREGLLGVSEMQTYLFNTGENYRSYEFLGCHRVDIDGRDMWRFAVWAPNAQSVKVACDRNGWTGDGMELAQFGDTGVWVGATDTLKNGDLYKYAVTAPDGTVYLRSDPYARRCELRPGTASVVYDEPDYKWTDKTWMNKRAKFDAIHSPMNIYECHAGSWRIHDDGSL